MRVLSVITSMASLTLSLPMLLWSVGLSASALAMLHFCAFLMTIRLLFLAATITTRDRDILWIGGIAGVIGALTSQIVLHWPGTSTNLALAFGAYGSLGARIFRLDVFTWWWPFLITLWSGALYALVGILVFHLARWRRLRLTA